MFKCWILRHAPTIWNEMGLIQGLSDIPLSEAGIQTAHSWQLPDKIKRLKAYSSPLKRAFETAEILGFDPIVEPLITEMNWGQFEGERLDYLRMENPQMMLDNEAKGLYFFPPMGESPFEVQGRLKKFFDRESIANQDIILITHKGVIRSLYSLATGWDMVGEPPHKLKDQSLHSFIIRSPGDITLDQVNIPLLPAETG